MGKKFSKVLGIFLALALILTAVPTAFAAPKDSDTGVVQPREGKFTVTINTSSNKILMLGKDDMAKLDVYAAWSAEKKDGTKVQEALAKAPQSITVDKASKISFDVDVPEKIAGNDVDTLKNITLKVWADADSLETLVSEKAGKVEVKDPTIKAKEIFGTDMDLIFLGNAVGGSKEDPATAAQEMGTLTFDQIVAWVGGDNTIASPDVTLNYNFTFEWVLNQTKESTIRVFKDGTDEPISGAKIKFYNVKVDGEKYALDENHNLMVGDEVEGITGNYMTDKNGTLTLGEGTLKNLPGKAKTAVIAVKAEHKDYKNSTVSFISLSNDLNDQIPGLGGKNGVNAVLRMYNTKEQAPFEVRVFAEGRKDALHAVEGVEVTINKDASEYMQGLKLGEVLYNGKTDKNGIAYVKDHNVLISEVEKTQPVKDKWTQVPYKAYSIITVKKDGKVINQHKIEDKDIQANYYEVKINEGRKPLFPRIEGEDRYETAVKIAKEQYPNGLVNKTVILATGQNFADALTANGLTNIYQAPILLTKTDNIPESVMAYLKAEQAEGRLENVLIVGKTGAVSNSVSEALTKMRLNVARVGGSNRFETAIEIAKLLKAAEGEGKIPFSKNADLVAEDRTKNDTYFLANGFSFADALIASVPSSRYGYPILLTDGSNHLRPETKSFLDDAFKAGKLNKILVMGGTAVVSEGAKSDVPGSKVDRLYGQDRYQTNMAVNEYFKNATKVYVVTGEAYADALVAGHLAAENNAAILMVSSKGLTKEQSDWIKKNDKITDYVIVGGDKAVSEKVEMEIEDIVLGITK
ncbi:cell wall-binding repeat-containing protein [Kallipyga massiliensis]|uniref:cell wall-binding repeat-containing protein n=1 Tax=Kallipyga massiliensis TaxID=1472764 RepID=UPI000558A63D|nr:cell wall-binding repeat-containing protein [Kallipyga massiliensis]